MNRPDVDFIIYGSLPSMKNQRRIVTIKNRPMLIKSKKALTYKGLFEEQCPQLDPLLEGDLSIRCDIWYDSKRPDLGGCDYVMDLCQKFVYANDKQIKMNMAIWNLARKDPRVRVRISKLPVSGLENLTVNYKPHELMDYDEASDE
jgi:hypothetical protein